MSYGGREESRDTVSFGDPVSCGVAQLIRVQVRLCLGHGCQDLGLLTSNFDYAPGRRHSIGESTQKRIFQITR